MTYVDRAYDTSNDILFAYVEFRFPIASASFIVDRVGARREHFLSDQVALRALVSSDRVALCGLTLPQSSLVSDARYFPRGKPLLPSDFRVSRRDSRLLRPFYLL